MSTFFDNTGVRVDFNIYPYPNIYYRTDMVEKIQKGLAASKKGFAYLHIFSPCPTGWAYKSDEGITVARKAVRSNMFPLWEMADGKLTINDKNPKPITVADFVKGIGKFKELSPEAIAEIQGMVDRRWHLLKCIGEGTL